MSASKLIKGPILSTALRQLRVLRPLPAVTRPLLAPVASLAPKAWSVRTLRTSTHALAVQQFKLADIGEGIAEVTLTEWFIKEGDMVKEMQNVCSVESDKASVELTSPYTGRVTKLHHKVQSQVKVGSVLIDVETGGGDSSASAAPKSAPKATPTPSAAPVASGAVQQFKLADIGEGIAEVQLTQWFVKVGDKVKEMDNLCSVESDKASVELTSPYSGTVSKLHYNVQDTVKVGSILVDITPSGAAASVSPAATSSAPAAKAATAASAPAAGGSKVEAFKLADIGEGIAEVQLTEWFVKEGDSVKEMQNLCSVESDKASVELTSPFTGTVKKIHFKVNDKVKVGSTLVEIETASGAPVKAAPAAAPAASAPAAAVSAVPAAKSAPASAASGAKAPGVLATPKVRHLAKEMGIDLNTVSGTGALGRVLEEDLKASVKTAAPTTATVAAKQSAASKPAAAPLVFRPPPRSTEDKVVQITDMVGKGMVKSMIESLSVPYMALGEEIDMTELLALQKQVKELALKKYGTKVTVTSFMMKALSMALQEHPKVNSKFGPADANPSYFTQYGSHNISVAIDSPFGLVVPNIKDVGNLSVLEIQNELMRLAAAAQEGKLAINDIKGGTITLSNIGVIGTKDPRPILFDGQAVIGATGRTMVLPRYDAKMQLVPRQIMNVRWVGDHRHLDGASLARFSNSFKYYVENPAEWALSLR
jgi:2-oxoisovalerate dehydrogenase E2 component (dihydrolipoyl transacylase)